MSSYDAIVVGAGPAGSATAALLSAEGLRVIMLEKDPFPRYKACAGGVDGIAAGMLEKLGVDFGPAVEDVATELRITYRGGNPTTYVFQKPLAHLTMRSDLDTILATRAVERGVEFRDGEAVRAIEEQDGTVQVTTKRGSYTGRAIVGADGVYSRVARTYRLNSRPIRYVLRELEVRPGDEVQRWWQGRTQIDISVWPLGYGWVFPKQEHLSLGAGVPFVRAKALAPFVDRFVSRLHLGDHTVLARHAHQIAFRRMGEAVSSGRALVVGDAAGLVDPNTGGGIGWALRSAEYASGAVLSYLKGEVADLRGYSAIIDRTIGREHHLARVLRNTVALRFLMFGGRATAHRPMWEQITRVIRGEEDYAGWYAKSRLAKLTGWTSLVPL